MRLEVSRNREDRAAPASDTARFGIVIVEVLIRAGFTINVIWQMNGLEEERG